MIPNKKLIMLNQIFEESLGASGISFHRFNNYYIQIIEVNEGRLTIKVDRDGNNVLIEHRQKLDSDTTFGGIDEYSSEMYKKEFNCEITDDYDENKKIFTKIFKIVNMEIKLFKI